MSRFAVIPAVPYTGVEQWEVQTLNAMIQNVNLLTANQERKSITTQAILRSTYDVAGIVPEVINIPLQQLPNRPLSGIEYVGLGNGSIYDPTPPTYDTLVNQCALASDMNKMLLEIADLRSVVNNIIAQLVQ
jgi:hypothetical protein